VANEFARVEHPRASLVAAVRDSDALATRPLPRRAVRTGRVIRTSCVLAMVVGDVAAIVLAFLLAYQIRAAMEPRPSRLTPFSDYVPTLAFQIFALVATIALMRLYLPRRGASHSEHLGAIFLAVTIGNVMAMALAAFSLRGLDVPRPMLIYAWGLSILFVWVSRLAIEQGMRLARRAGLDPELMIIIGPGNEGHTILRKILAAPELGYRVIGFVGTGEPLGGAVDGAAPPVSLPGAANGVDPPVLGSLGDLPRLLEMSGAREVVVADPELTHAEVLDVVAACDRARVNVKVFPDVFQLVVREVGVSELGGLPMLRVRDVNLRGWNLLVKRALDIVLSATLLILLSPVMIAVAIAVKLSSSQGPVFFIQERVGVDGRPFACAKFRTMHVDAEAQTGPVWALPDDARTTRLGRWLRHYSIDELPQLVNVLMGDMSLVGPRPERPYFVEQFRRFIPRYEKRHQEKAGVTGWAQVNGLRGQSPIEERTLYDLFYVEHWSPAFDLKILIQTIAAVVRGRNAY